MKSFITKTFAILCGLALISTASAQTQIEVKVTTTGPVGLAPVFAAFHDGSYDIFDTGGMATAGLETLAEVGDPSAIVSEAMAAGVSSAGGFAPGGPFAPAGGMGSHIFMVDSGDASFALASIDIGENCKWVSAVDD